MGFRCMRGSYCNLISPPFIPTCVSLSGSRTWGNTGSPQTMVAAIRINRLGGGGGVCLRAHRPAFPLPPFSSQLCYSIPGTIRHCAKMWLSMAHRLNGDYPLVFTKSLRVCKMKGIITLRDSCCFYQHNINS